MASNAWKTKKAAMLWLPMLGKKRKSRHAMPSNHWNMEDE